MNLEVLNIRDHQRWNAYLGLIPFAGRSPHFAPEYLRLFEERGEGRAVCLAGVEGENVILYPALVNSVNELGYKLYREFFDLQGAYGYNGPVTNCKDQGFLDRFSRLFEEYCRQTGIIAEFIRFCPVIGNLGLLPHVRPIHALDNVLIDLSGGFESVWHDSFDNGVRKAVRKAERAGVACRIVPGEAAAASDIDAFMAIYDETMSRNQAGSYYAFPREFIAGLCAGLPGQTLLVLAELEGRAVSAELVLLNPHHAYGFLGGTLSASYASSPNSFLRCELVRYLIRAGLQFYSIGGGKSRGDSIYLFKKSFSRKLESPFYIGRHVHDQRVYDEVVAQWEQRFPEKVEIHKNLLLKYRV